MTFSVDKFRQHFAQRGDFAKPSKFDVRIFRNKLRGGEAQKSSELSFQCDAAELPGMTLNTIDSKVYGAAWHVATIPTYEETTLTFLCSSDMWERRYFEDWMQIIVPTEYFNYNERPSHPAYQDEYLSTVVITQYKEFGDSNGSPIIGYRCALMDAFPTSIQPITLDWGSEEVMKLQVNFKYRVWGRHLSERPVENAREQATNQTPNGDGK